MTRAQIFGVCGFLLVAEDIPTLKRSLELVRTVENAFVTAAFDPWHSEDTTRVNTAKKSDKSIKKFLENDINAYFKELEQIIEVDSKTAKKIVAIGKCGLDYDKAKSINKDFQIQLFEKHF